MTHESVARRGTTHHRTDERFMELLSEDYDVRPFYMRSLVGVPKKQSIRICEWASGLSTDSEERGRAIRNWTRKHGVGSFDRRLLDAPPETFEQSEHERRVREGRGS